MFGLIPAKGFRPRAVHCSSTKLAKPQNECSTNLGSVESDVVVQQRSDTERPADVRITSPPIFHSMIWCAMASSFQIWRLDWD